MDKTVEDIYELYASRLSQGVPMPFFIDAVREELAEVESAQTCREREQEYGDLLSNVISLGAYFGIPDPLRAAQKSIDGAKARMAFISQRIRTRPGDDGYHEEYANLWSQSKEAGL